ncbi:MAG: sigma-70 family RNA polymerase sigma factor [Bacteroidota bacterium]
MSYSCISFHALLHENTQLSLTKAFQEMAYLVKYLLNKSNLDRDHQSEVLGDAFMKLYKNKNFRLIGSTDLEKENKCKAFVRRAVHFEILNLHKKLNQNKKKNISKIEDIYVVDKELASYQPEIQGGMDDDFKKSWDNLPISDQELLVKKYVEKNSIRELAEELGVSEEVIKTRLSRARKKFKVHYPSSK